MALVFSILRRAVPKLQTGVCGLGLAFWLGCFGVAHGAPDAARQHLLEQARGYLEGDRPADAISLLEEAGIAQDIHYWRIRRDALAAQGDWKASLHAARACLRMEGADPYEDRLALGDSLFGASDFDQARIIYDQCIQLAPERTEAYLQRAKILAWQNRTAELSAVLENVRGHLSTAAQWDQYARLQMMGGNLEQAEAAGLKAASIDPSQKDSYSLIAAICEARRNQGKDMASGQRNPNTVIEKADHMFSIPGRNRAERLAWKSAIDIASGRLDEGLQGASRLILSRTVAYQVIGLKMKIEVLLQLGYGADVLKEARQLTDLHSNAFEPLMLRAQVEAAAGYAERGLQLAEQAMAVRPNDYRASLVKARILWALQKRQQAIAEMLRAEELAGDVVTPSWEVGLWYMVEGAWADAAARFERVRKNKPHHLGAMLKWAQCRLHLNPEARDFPAFVQIIRKLHAVQDDQILVFLVECINHTQAAVSEFGLEQMSLLYLAEGEFEKVEPLIQRLKEAESGSLRWRVLEWQWRLGKGESAEVVFREAKQALKTSAEELFVLGRMAEQGGLQEEAIGIYRRLTEQQEPGWSSRASFRVGILLEARGEIEAAILAYQTALQLDEENYAAANNLALLLVASEDTRDEAKRYVPALTAAMDQPAYLDTAGWILVQLGQPREGLMYLRMAQQWLPDEPEINFHVAQACFDAGLMDQSRLALERSLRSIQPFPSSNAARSLRDKLEAISAESES